MTESYAAENIGDYLKLIDQAISGIEQEITVSGHDDEHHIHQVKDYLETILNVRRYDDGGKVPGVQTPNLEHYLEIARKVLARQPAS